MQKLLQLLGAKSDDALAVGIGDLYVTVFGGRNRLLGTLLGRGLTLEDSLRQLEGITLEGNVITKRIVKALRKWSACGKINILDFPLIDHLGDVLLNNKAANIPWETFTGK
jgi:glycerol-3-phosphate dehydrogenase (NAD(P)+)